MQRKHTNIFVPAKGNNEPVEMVSSFEYLGILVDNKLRFSDNIYIYIFNHRNFCISCASWDVFDASHELLEVVYKSLVESVLTFNIVVWYGNIGVKGKAKLEGVCVCVTDIVRTHFQ